MSRLKSLQLAKNLTDLAKLLGFTPSGMAYVLYKVDTAKKYKIFQIPKKNGGARTICAPNAELSLLQSRLSELLYHCVDELRKDNPRLWNSSHGFRSGRTIVSNAEVHRRRRFVFNVDIEDFFGTINFGRVRGFFINDHGFSLLPPTATLIAQIASHENSLPQGSPCSPVISNLIGNILDMRLIALAKRNRCTYTRYADDLTFSTNETHFPQEIAINTFGSAWATGTKLETEVTRAGFRLNQSKTRMSLKRSRQTVTGLVVNKKANVNKDYYRSVRSMCNEVFQRGSYYKPVSTEGAQAVPMDNLNALEGMLSHIYFVKARRDRLAKINKLAHRAGEFDIPKAPIELYGRFLFYKHFVNPGAPIIVTEGISDITYLRCAIRTFATKIPTLVKTVDGVQNVAVNFLKPSGTTRDIINLGHGASGQADLIARYTNQMKKYGFCPIPHPVIILCDNDAGPEKVFKNARNKSGKQVSLTTNDPFYFLGENLYLVKVPEGTTSSRVMEDLFPAEWLTKKLDGKSFDPKKEHGDAASFGKVVFAEKIVRPNAKNIDFSEFEPLLMRINDCINDYAKNTAVKAQAIAASSAKF